MIRSIVCLKSSVFYASLKFEFELQKNKLNREHPIFGVGFLSYPVFRYEICLTEEASL